MSILESNTYLNDLRYLVENTEYLSNFKNKSILVTGSTGLICSAIIDVLLEANLVLNNNTKIYIAARNMGKAKERFLKFPDKNLLDYIEFVKYDATKSIDFSFKADYIIHGASNAHPKAFVKYPVETMVSNLFGLDELLKYSKKVMSKNLVYISSSEVYGNKENLDPFKENDYGYIDILSSRNAYASSKRASETLCNSYYDEYGVKSCIVRPGHIYGPTASRDDSRVGSSFAYSVVDGEDIVLKSSGEQIRSYCYVLDCASAILCVLIKGYPGVAYNISNRNSIMSIADIAKFYADEGNVNICFNLPTDEEKKAFNPMINSSLDSTKLELLGWRGLFDSKKGTAHTIRVLRGD